MAATIALPPAKQKNPEISATLQAVLADLPALEAITGALSPHEKEAEDLLKLAIQYCNGKGVVKDIGKGILYLQKAAKLKYAPAQYYLGGLYRRGISYQQGTSTVTFAEDNQKAFELMKWAAEQNYVLAYNVLGLYYQKGIGTAVDLKKAFESYELAAKQNNAGAQYNLGIFYEGGIGVAVDTKLAFYWYTLAAKQNNVLGQIGVGHCYRYGKGVAKDLQKALYFYQLAAHQGHEKAKKTISELKKELWAEKARKLKTLCVGVNANQGKVNCGYVAERINQHLQHQTHLGGAPVPTAFAHIHLKITPKKKGLIQIVRSYTKNTVLLTLCSPPHPSTITSERIDLTDDVKGEIIEIDLETGKEISELKLIQTNAKEIVEQLKILPRGNDGCISGFLFLTHANNKNGHISNFYVDSEDQVFFIDAQPQDSKAWVLPHPSQIGYRPEFFYFPCVPLGGYKVKAEHSKAEPDTTIEAKRLYKLALQYLKGKGVTKEVGIGMGYLQQAVALGYAPAQHSLGLSYENGRGFAVDLIKAFQYYQLAAMQNYPPAQDNLAICYLRGLGVAKDDKEAFKYFGLAAEENDVQALNNLGQCYYLGIGTPKDFTKARHYFRLAADQGNQMAKENILRLEKSVLTTPVINSHKRSHSSISSHVVNGLNGIAADGTNKKAKVLPPPG